MRRGWLLRVGKAEGGSMSYDIKLCDPVTGEVLETLSPHEMRGGTYCIEGTTELWLNVTYNYSGWYSAFGMDGIRSIYGLSGAMSIPVLEKAIETIRDKGFRPELEADVQKWCDKQNELNARRGIHDTTTADSYWCPTREHALVPLYQLLSTAQMRPDGVWDGD